MKHVIFLLISLFLISAIAQPSEVLALLNFKKSITHDPTGYVTNSWNEKSIDFNGCPSYWNGIVCNGGYVAGIVLDNLGLSADIDLLVFSNLTKLIKLSMANNSISGKVSESISVLKSLHYLDLSNNLFSSSLPPGIGRLAGLKNASFAGNNFSGSLPDSFSGLTLLQYLDLSYNSFSNDLPLSLAELMNLVHLNLSHNRFLGRIPRGFELIPTLKMIDLHDNMLVGHLDINFLLISNVEYVDFSRNLLVSSELEQRKFIVSEMVQHLNLSHNRLTGSLVDADFRSLKVLDLSYNQFSGDLPEFNFVYDLEVLNLSNNRFSGVFPSNLLKGDPLVITDLDISANNLSGPLVTIASTTLRLLNLSANALSGELPLLIGSCSVLVLSNNQFEGSIMKITKWVDVEYLDLSQNRLSGSVPEPNIGSMRLNHLNLSHNLLLGSLPRNVLAFAKLEVLDISYNHLNGSLPPGFLMLPLLQELHVEHNSIAYPIKFTPPPIELDLRVIDLSHNIFSGSLPDKLGLLTHLQHLNLAGNRFSGALPASISAIKSLRYLDISQNQFMGSLPFNLAHTLESLNVSYNNLSGTLPDYLRKFPPSCFHPGNSRLKFSSFRPSQVKKNSSKKGIKIVLVIVTSALSFLILVLILSFMYYIHKLKKKQADTGNHPEDVPKSYSERVDLDKMELQWSPDSGESSIAGTLGRLDVRSPDLLVGELCTLDDSLTLTKEELSQAPAEVLGRSSHGTSYRASMENRVVLTVKWLKEGVAKDKKDFMREARKLGNIKHPNVVSLRGYYWGPTQHERLLLSEYISPGNLESFLYDRPGRRDPTLSWGRRLRIAVDIARGLNYLHFDRSVPHGNLKAANILLEGPDLNARVADYSLHRLMTPAGVMEQVLDSGALGYRAPEFAGSRKPQPSFKSDVYSFGVLLLELLTGRCAGEVVSGVDLAEWVLLRATDGRYSQCFDAMLTEEMADPGVSEGMKEVMSVALRCIRPVSERPGIKSVYEELSSI